MDNIIQKIAIALIALIIGVSCGKVDLTPNRHKSGKFAYIFVGSSQKPDDVALDFATYRVAQQFKGYLGENPMSKLCCGRVQVYVHPNKPLSYQTGKRHIEFVHPQESGSIWDGKLFDKKRGLDYHLGKHFADRLFPPHFTPYEKAKHVSYSEGEWEIEWDKSKVPSY